MDNVQRLKQDAEVDLAVALATAIAMAVSLAGDVELVLVFLYLVNQVVDQGLGDGDLLNALGVDALALGLGTLATGLFAGALDALDIAVVAGEGDALALLGRDLLPPRIDG